MASRTKRVKEESGCVGCGKQWRQASDPATLLDVANMLAAHETREHLLAVPEREDDITRVALAIGLGLGFVLGLWVYHNAVEP